VRHRDPLQRGLRLAQLDKLLELGVRQRFALEQPDHAGVGSGLLGGAGAGADGQIGHGGAVYGSGVGETRR
jgi:hypothetical protein